MRTKISVLIAATAAAAALALAGCSSGGAGGSGSGMPGASTGSSPAAGSGTAATSVLTTAATSLGTVVVDGTGRTVYVFDEDTQNAGKSSCTGACAAQWPAVQTDAAAPAVTGVSGTVGTITGVDGGRQVTLDGRPLYTYAGDASAGDTTGQGVGGSWWAVSPDGMRIGAAATTGGGGSGYSK